MVAKANHLWTTGQIVTIQFLDGDWQTQYQVQQWAIEALQYANLKFLWFFNYPDNKEIKYDANIRIALFEEKFPEHGVHCAVGTECLMYPSASPTMILNRVTSNLLEVEKLTKQLVEGLSAESKEKGFTRDYITEFLVPHYLRLAKATVQHEFMHALGISHEQCHPDSGIEWKEPERFLSKNSISTGYNKASVMHYPYNQYKAHIKEEAQEDLDDNHEMNRYRYKLSEEDIKGITYLYSKIILRRHPISWEGMMTTGRTKHEIQNS